MLIALVSFQFLSETKAQQQRSETTVYTTGGENEKIPVWLDHNTLGNSIITEHLFEGFNIPTIIISRPEIGLIDAERRLYINGLTETNFLRISQDFTKGYILKSDEHGNALWIRPKWWYNENKNIIYSENLSSVNIGYIPEDQTYSGSGKLNVVNDPNFIKNIGIKVTSGPTGEYPPFTDAGFFVGSENGIYSYSENGNAIFAETMDGYGVFQAGGPETKNCFLSNTGINREVPLANLHISDKLTLHEINTEDYIAYNLYGDNRRTYSDHSSKLSFGNDGSISLMTSESGASSYQPDWNLGLFIDYEGKTGIGTSNPTSHFEVFGEVQPKFTLSNPNGNLIIAIADQPGDFAPGSQPMDVVFKTHDINNHHGMIFNINDNYGDGDGYIKFNDYLNHSTLSIYNNGKIGIHQDNPSALLHIENPGDPGDKLLQIGDNTYFTDTELKMNGKIVLGNNPITPGTYRLYVEDGILAEKVKVELTTNWSDFVFEENYPLKPIDELESFIKLNKHLPEIPSAMEVEEDGIDLGEMDAKLLQKIEELTLYIIEQQKQIEALKTEVEELKK